MNFYVILYKKKFYLFYIMTRLTIRLSQAQILELNLTY